MNLVVPKLFAVNYCRLAFSTGQSNPKTAIVFAKVKKLVLKLFAETYKPYGPELRLSLTPQEQKLLTEFGKENFERFSTGIKVLLKRIRREENLVQSDEQRHYLLWSATHLEVLLDCLETLQGNSSVK